jgi:hypothetical protein
MSDIRSNGKDQVRVNILKEISNKLTQYYGVEVDALSWFIVLYHGSESTERHTYRDIADLLITLGISHTGRDGTQKYYNNTSIQRLLVDMGWDSYEHTHHTNERAISKRANTSLTALKRAKTIADDIRKKI